MKMISDQGQFHIFILPYLALGHVIPVIDMARIFINRGIKPTIVATSLNLPFLAETIDINNQDLDIKIDLVALPFPTAEAGLPPGYGSPGSVSSPDTVPLFFKAIELLQHPFENLVKGYHPNCIIADSLFPWSPTVARKFGIPCLSFHGVSYFYQCIFSNLHIYQPHKTVPSDSEPFIVPNLPHEIKLTRFELADEDKQESSNWLTELVDQIREGEKSCYGVIMNSFYELEPAYVDYYEKVLEMKHWHIGPLSLYFQKRNEGTYFRGKTSSIDVADCMKWLDQKEPNSVIYICFGSKPRVPDAQLREIATSLELLAQNFILVVGENKDHWQPHGFSERTKDHGFVIKGWAPQSLILHHRAVGGFMTHCGWNSILEGVTAGLPMVTWPRHADQFYNEKLLTVVLKIAVPVGMKRWVPRHGNDNEDIINSQEILKAITMVMNGKEAEDMRRRATELKDMARLAIDEDGSSYSSLSALIDELKSYNK